MNLYFDLPVCVQIYIKILIIGTPNIIAVNPKIEGLISLDKGGIW